MSHTTHNKRFWPPHLPEKLNYPQTSLDFNLTVSARRFPDRTFISFYGTDITWGEADTDVTRIAAFLQQSCKLQRGDRVVLYSQNSPQFILAFYGILRAGGVVVPVNPMNVSSELAYYVKDSEAKIAFCAQELMPNIIALPKGTLESVIGFTYSDYICNSSVPVPEAAKQSRVTFDSTLVTSWQDVLRTSAIFVPPTIGPDDLAVLPYTSGTTGNPKGCMHTHGSVMATAVGFAIWEHLSPESTMLTVAPMCHATGMQIGMNRCVYAGATIVLMQRWDPAAAGVLIEQYQCTHWNSVPVMAVDLLMHPETAKRDLSSLRVVSGGGAAMPKAMAEKLWTDLGLRFIEGYGMTETICQTHLNPIERPKEQCLGIPSFDVEAIIVDPETHRVLPVGEVGEIVVRGPQLLKGYWHNEAAYMESWIEVDGRSWFRTGDLGYVDDEGYFFFADRLKRMINASGFKIWPAEVEAVMYGHPDIRECCVIASPDQRRGETVKAVIVLNDAISEDRDIATEITSWAQSKMAAYKVPRKIEFVKELPRGSSGKLDWRKLQEGEFTKPL